MSHRNESHLAVFDPAILDQLADGVLDGGGTIYDDAGEIMPDTVKDSRYPADFQRLAFQVWAFDAGENIEQTSKILEERTGLRVGAATLRRWRDTAQWPRVAADVHQKVRNSAVNAIQRMTDVGMVRAARWAAGVFDREDVSDNVKARVMENLFGRFGFPLLLRSELFSGINVLGGDLADMSDDELQEEWQNYQLDPGNATTPIDTEPTPILNKLSDAEVDRSYLRKPRGSNPFDQ